MRRVPQRAAMGMCRCLARPDFGGGQGQYDDGMESSEFPRRLARTSTIRKPKIFGSFAVAAPMPLAPPVANAVRVIGLLPHP